MSSRSRRQFLWLSAGAGGAVAVGALVSGKARQHGGGDRPPRAGGETPRAVRRTCRAFGSAVTLSAVHDDPDVARRAIDHAFVELEAIESLMSIYRPDSALSRLNRDGVLAEADPRLREVLSCAHRLSQESDGAFDVTVQPLWNHFRRAEQAGRLPLGEEIEAARSRIDWRGIGVSGSTVRLKRGVELTLNGIAQGYACDRVADVFRRHGVSDALIDTGEIGALGSKGAGDPWTVGIQDPRRDDAFVCLAQLAGRFLATSGDYATAFTPDRANHHLFDPHTGRSANAFASVSIAARSGMEADALSTAVFVSGEERGLRLVLDTPGADALFVRKDGSIAATPGFPLAS